MALGAASVGVFARQRPALRHGLWLLVLLKLVTPPLWTVPVAWVEEPGQARAKPPLVSTPPEDVLEPGQLPEDGLVQVDATPLQALPPLLQQQAAPPSPTPPSD